MEPVYRLPHTRFNDSLSPVQSSLAREQLEQGRILYFPDLYLQLQDIEHAYLEELLSAPHKALDHPISDALLYHFAAVSHTLVTHTLPNYANHLETGPTYLRQPGIDKAVKTDRSPSHKRVLKVFTNIHPADEPCIWQIANHNAVQTESPEPSWLARFADMPLIGHKKQQHSQDTQTSSRVVFPAHSCWMIFTDQRPYTDVSNALVLEQTFYPELR